MPPTKRRKSSKKLERYRKKNVDCRNRNHDSTNELIAQVEEQLYLPSGTVLIPACVLTNEQLALMIIFSLQVSRIMVGKLSYPSINDGGRDRTCLQPLWQVDHEGESFSTTGAGAIITMIACVDNKDGAWGKSNVTLIGEQRPNASGFVLLAHWNKLDLNSLKNPPVVIDYEMVYRISLLKYNLVKAQGTTHWGSRGKTFGFGWHASFSAVEARANLASMSEYMIKKIGRAKAAELFGTDDVSSLDDAGVMDLIVKLVKDLERLMTLAVEEGIECINASLAKRSKGTGIVQLGTTLNRALVETSMNVNPEICENIGLLGHTNYPALFLNVDSSTDEFHTEKDSSYTALYSTMQQNYKVNQRGPYSFKFLLNYNCRGRSEVVINMQVGVGIFFSSFFLLHRQVRDVFMVNPPSFWNISAYGSKALWENGKKTIFRNLQAIRELFADFM